MKAVLGIDCATVPPKRGVAIGRFNGNSCLITNVAIGLSNESIASIVKEESHCCNQLLLAFDAPLGWPESMGKALAAHKAGEPLLPTADNLFRRKTDRFIREKFNKQSLDVGADRIARTAHSALKLLAYLSEAIGYPVPLAWDTDFSGVAAIEVYPAATLRSYLLPDSGYKMTPDSQARQNIIDSLKETEELSFEVSTELPLRNADALDAVICSLAGLHFIQGSVHQPTNKELARKEGWIWVRKTEDDSEW